METLRFSTGATPPPMAGQTPWTGTVETVNPANQNPEVLVNQNGDIESVLLKPGKAVLYDGKVKEDLMPEKMTWKDLIAPSLPVAGFILVLFLIFRNK